MSLKSETKNQPFEQLSSRPISRHPGRNRPEDNGTFDAQNRTRYVIGGTKFGFGYRRRIFHEYIGTQLDPKARYDTGDIFIDSLERAPRPTDKMVSLSFPFFLLIFHLNFPLQT